MPTDTTRPLSIADRKRSIEADATLDQMYSYFTRDEMPRPVVSELDARKAA
ncbi:hypothetical protein [Paracoccus liaowanqingii]|uniref:hypothetical protein n=1 Tax=Paracoccus liaowanqingii TaxID=2560053 RepID=UPI00143DD541|nr:hypothetical protein [Paracoccus liaowanqingii]